MSYSKPVMLSAGISNLENANIFLPRSFRRLQCDIYLAFVENAFHRRQQGADEKVYLPVMLELPRDKLRFRFPAGSCSAPYIFSAHRLSAVSNRPPQQKHTRPEMILHFCNACQLSVTRFKLEHPVGFLCIYHLTAKLLRTCARSKLNLFA